MPITESERLLRKLLAKWFYEDGNGNLQCGFVEGVTVEKTLGAEDEKRLIEILNEAIAEDQAPRELAGSNEGGL